MNDDHLPPEDLGSEMTQLPEMDSTPTQVGNYRILQKIGEGGMGEVYEAEQHKPVRRRVALKLIKLGMDSKAVVARFESERQALALMNHAAIASVFDAGATPDGRLFFAMEFVKGIPITEYCDRHRLPVSERLDLFTEVCEGIQHAHQKGIIHRDIKPSNILVTVQDSTPAPKIIDFGVAKATDLRLTDRTLYTELGQLIGTPEYMSPEQTDLTGLDIDTRTDVYSLGVLLYELLVGEQPFAATELRQAGFEEFRRMIREDLPPRPSTQLKGLTEAVTTTAKNRTTNPPALSRQLRGDLDWIVLKALEKDRTRRYDSASELAADIRRHLNREPVLACPPSMLYRFGKFVSRHKAGVGAAMLVAIALVVGIMGTTIGMIRATQAEAEASRVSEFLVGLFKVSDPSETRGKTITAKEILDRGALQIRQELAEQPQIQARLMGTMGDVYLNLGLYDQSGPLLERALETRRDVLGVDHEETLASMMGLANLYRHQARYDDAEDLYTQALEGRRRLLGNDHPSTLSSMMGLANNHLRRGRYADAEPLYTKVLETKRRLLGADHPDTLKSMNNLASLYYEQGRYGEAERLYLQTIEARNQVLGEDHPASLGTVANLASLYQDLERYDEALPLCRRVLETEMRVLGEDHPNTLLSMGDLAFLHLAAERYDEAEPLFLRALEIQCRVLGDRHPDSLSSMNNLAFLYLRTGRYDEADRLYSGALEAQRQVLGEGHPITQETIYGLLSLRALQGRHAEALVLLRQAVESGWSDADGAREDSDLASLREDPEFEAILAEID